MIIARVTGTVVSTHKEERYRGVKLLTVQPLTFERKDTGKAIIAADNMDAGPGDIVLLARGREATFPFGKDSASIDRAVVGIVDDIDYHPEA